MNARETRRSAEEQPPSTVNTSPTWSLCSARGMGTSLTAMAAPLHRLIGVEFVLFARDRHAMRSGRRREVQQLSLEDAEALALRFQDGSKSTHDRRVVEVSSWNGRGACFTASVAAFPRHNLSLQWVGLLFFHQVTGATDVGVLMRGDVYRLTLPCKLTGVHADPSRFRCVLSTKKAASARFSLHAAFHAAGFSLMPSVSALAEEP